MPRERSKTHAKAPSHEQIARRAYELCLARGGEPGHELEDWLTAEKELLIREPVVAAPVPPARARATRVRTANP